MVMRMIAKFWSVIWPTFLKALSSLLLDFMLAVCLGLLFIDYFDVSNILYADGSDGYTCDIPLPPDVALVDHIWFTNQQGGEDRSSVDFFSLDAVVNGMTVAARYASLLNRVFDKLGEGMVHALGSVIFMSDVSHFLFLSCPCFTQALTSLGSC